ncbi:Receptor-like protein 12, partial [Mucuna pruriens]
MRIPHVPFLSIIFCYCFWIHHNVYFTGVSAQIVEDQQQSLLKLKSSLKFKYEKSSKLVSWNQSIDCCNWSGVACDDEGRVVGLDLSEESINGGLVNSSTLFSLQNLQILNLAANNFSSEIPSGFNKLTNLKYLNLSDAGFVGQIPMEISYMTKLVSLDISSLSYLYKQPLKLENLNLQMLFKNLTMITQLYMDGVIVTAQGNEWCNALLQLVSLQELSMSNCNLSGPLDTSLTRLKNLSIIHLDQNNLSSSVPETFANFSNLTTLHLGNCGLTGIFPEKIFKIATLSDIDLSFNINLYGSLPEFPGNGHLRTLIVSHTRFSGALPASISNLRQLSIVDLSNCHYNGTLPSSMSRLEELTYLDLSLNDFTGPIPSLNMSRNLVHLNLSYNDFTGSITSVHLEGLRKLVQIDLQVNLLNGSIPSSLFALPLLHSIQLSNNNFQGQLDEFSNSSSSMLEMLDLSNNALAGQIPLSIGNLNSLESLDLSSNLFDGEIPIQLASLNFLLYLNLSFNRLVGEIPVRGQFQTFGASSFVGNAELCGVPLIKNCSDGMSPHASPHAIDWSIIRAELGFVFGLALVIGPLLFWKQWRQRYWQRVNSILCRIFPQLNLEYETRVSAQIVEDQQQSLLKLKSSLKFKHENSHKLVSWIPSIDYREWRGVKCDEEGHVISLDLSGESINGGFDNSSTLFSLKNLQILNLSANNFSSEIPSGFDKLKNLKYLNLSDAGFVGQIPMEISYLTKLVSLDISSLSYLYKQPLKLENLNLQMLLKNLTMITQLYMDGVIVTAQGNEWCNALLQLVSLQELSMSNCNLSGPLDTSLTRLENLSIIHLDQNNLSSSVPETFANFSNLTTLHLGNCGLTGIFPEKIFKIATLSDIDLSFNIDLYGSLPEFPGNGHLRTLIVSHTRFSGALPASISNLRQLSIIDLSSCHYNGTLPSSMSRLEELTYLDLSQNDFTGPIPSLNMSRNLVHLDLSHNDFTGSITSVHLEGLRKLVQIDLQVNSLNGSIPSSLFALPLVRSIQLSNNNFQGQLDEFSNISSSMLETLDISSNYLEGPIPHSIFNLTSLSVLQLSFNKLNGTLKLDAIQGLAYLTTLALSHNHLSIDTSVTNASLVSSFSKMTYVELASCNLIEFPSFLRNQSHISTLDLSSNNIQGSIPTWIWRLDSLFQLNLSHNLLGNLEGPVQNTSSKVRLLDLHSNQLQGKLPIFPVNLIYLDYSSNNLSFSIPSEVGTSLSSIIFLSLSKNNLSGSIPQSLCNNSNLLVLDVSYNHFNGMIPECLTQSETLVVLNLQHNMFNGSIPDKFPVSCALRTLDLNSNLLRGPIPKSLANCTSLEVLDLGNNQLDDGFPCFLQTISTLRVMVLMRNKFHGHIGCPNTNGTWHMLQIVDVAFNNFNGLLPGKCFKTWKAMMLDEYHDGSKLNRIGPVVLTLGGIFYQDSVTLTVKGLQMEFVKVLNLVTSVDFSSNNFHGTIPEELMHFTRLIFLNLSHNALAGQIPLSIGNLNRLESLDLSSNHFDGVIPIQLANLSFLSYLNLSFNSLVGTIPIGTQIQTFEASSFIGNVELCGSPLPKNCSDMSNAKEDVPKVYTDGGVKFDWTFVSIGLGFGVGAGLVVAPSLFLERLKKWSSHKIDKVLLVVIPMFGLIWIPVDDDEEEEEDTKENNSDMEEECDYNEEQKNFGHLRFQGQYCVLCSKLDISKEK